MDEDNNDNNNNKKNNTIIITMKLKDVIMKIVCNVTIWTTKVYIIPQMVGNNMCPIKGLFIKN